MRNTPNWTVKVIFTIRKIINWKYTSELIKSIFDQINNPSNIHSDKIKNVMNKLDMD